MFLRKKSFVKFLACIYIHLFVQSLNVQCNVNKLCTNRLFCCSAVTPPKVPALLVSKISHFKEYYLSTKITPLVYSLAAQVLFSTIMLICFDFM